jgi:uncharacterized membrane protein YphA (DoxX/SURF4 family)
MTRLTRAVAHLDNLPRYALGVVYLIFGIDKFAGFDRYMAWFAATSRTQALVPGGDVGSFVYAMGTVEVILAILLFSGLFARKTAVAVSAALVAILSVAQYPSSFPQDLGLLATSIMLISVSNGKGTGEKYSVKFSKLPRLGLSAVLFLWAADHMLYTNTHVSWLQLSNVVFRAMPVNQVFAIVITIAVVELALGGLIAAGRLRMYPYIASTAFFVTAFFVMAPPLNNYQSIGLAIISSWLACVVLRKRQSDQTKKVIQK